MFSWRRSWRNKHTPNHLPGTRFPHVLCVFLSALLLLQLLSAFIFAVTCKSVSKDLMQSRCSFFLIHPDNFKLCSSWLIAHSLSELHRSAILVCHFTDTCDAAIGIHPRHHAREHKLNQAVTYSREVNSTWWKTSSCLFVSALWWKGDLSRVDNLSVDNELSDVGGPIPTLSHSSLVDSFLKSWNLAIFGIKQPLLPPLSSCLSKSLVVWRAWKENCWRKMKE